MADLNKELNEYLLSSKNEKQFKITVPLVTIPKTNIKKWFGKSEENKEEIGWMQGAQKECCPSMTRIQRLIAFVLCFSMGILCFCLSAIYIPVLLLKARKFALLYTLGSLFFLSSFCFLLGPLSYLKSLFTAERRCFTISYIATLIGTLYCALHLQSTPLTVFCAVLQLIAMLSFLISHIPGGTKGLMFFTKICKSSVNSTLPI
ncbi:PREDICTED: protein transport protein SFT2 [Eufriesea mexicana]|uniref:protein transport protein SFT2 n=1 Tax=Eufriesea mexicana TaxID=516756 RepID=UPI00083C72FA|nr:PREDICTED: protein transport protein SFT2 [Eufriesea mexicana]